MSDVAQGLPAADSAAASTHDEMICPPRSVVREQGHTGGRTTSAACQYATIRLHL